MNETIVFPRLSNNKSTSELIVICLANEWPLSLKALHHRIQKEHGKQVSYQSVHKAAKKLLEERVLRKEIRHYRINLEWLDHVHIFAKTVKKAYRQKKSNYDPKHLPVV